MSLILLQSFLKVTCGFVSPVDVRQSVRSCAPTTSLSDVDADTTEEDSLTTSSSSAIWNWNAANSSLGSLLLRLQKEEEEEMKRAVGQATNTTASSTSTTSYRAASPPTAPPQNELVPMDLETARELDDAVTKGSKDDLLNDIEVLPSSSLYSTLTKMKRTPKAPSASRTRLFRRIKQEEEFDPEILNMPLSMPEHYDERITRDMRHLAVSISSNVDEVWQWRLFCQEKGGIVPLLKCIQEGARFIREHINEDGNKDSEFAKFDDRHEETFMAACTACRALRDLCAISPELSAVITDGILRANDLWGEEGPLSDFVTLLHHADEVEIKREARDIFTHNRRNRRGTF